MKRFMVEIELNNTVFNHSPHLEVSRILNTVARKIDEEDFKPKYNHEFLLFDSNGDECGIAKLIYKEE